MRVKRLLGRAFCPPSPLSASLYGLTTGVIALAFLWALWAPGVAQEVTLQVAVRWAADDPEAEGIYRVAEAFERNHPGVTVEFIHSATLSDQIDHVHTSKLMTLVAAGLSPDVTMVGGHVVPQYAALGMLMPIDKYVEESGVRAEDFVPAAWEQTRWLGRHYAMTLHVDPNFALLWNKEMFAEAGLNADVPPETLSEYEEYFRRLTRVGDDGALTQIGAIPWDVYGHYNTLFTWGWIFGGRFYDYETNRVTAADPAIVEAFEFLRDYYERYANILPPMRSARLFSGRVAMSFEVSTQFKALRETLGEDVIGGGLMPYRDGGEPNPSWIGGFALGILPEARHPDLAWEFIRFATATPEGTEIFGATSASIPAYLPSPAHQDFLMDPVMAVYLTIAQTARNRRPGMPAIADYATALENAFIEVMAGRTQPREALEFVEQVVQARLDEILGR